jgi:MFS family permease
MQGSFWLFVISLFLMGMSNAFNQQYRFAAIDAGSPSVRTKAMSLVMAGGMFSGIIGPQTVILTSGWLGPIPVRRQLSGRRRAWLYRPADCEPGARRGAAATG